MTHDEPLFEIHETVERRITIKMVPEQRETPPHSGLTDEYIKALLADPRAAGRRYGDTGGLYLQVPKPGTISPRRRYPPASWLFRYERNGRERWMGLGPLHTFSLDDARELARQCRKQLAAGIDPLSTRPNRYWRRSPRPSRPSRPSLF
jgi:hypothetical protein